MTYVTDNFRELVKLFEDPQSRTRRRLRPVYADTLAAAAQVMVDGQTFFADADVPDVQAKWNDLLGNFMVRGFQVYGPELVPAGVAADDLDNWGDLDPDALAQASWEGLIETGGGKVPDAALPSILAAQINVLQKHEKLLGRSWFDSLIERISRIPFKLPDIPTPNLEPVFGLGKLILAGLALVVAIKVVSK